MFVIYDKGSHTALYLTNHRTPWRIADWFFISYVNLFPAYAFPSPQAVLLSFREEILAGRLVNDIIASLWRVAVGFVLSVLLGVPLVYGLVSILRHAKPLYRC